MQVLSDYKITKNTIINAMREELAHTKDDEQYFNEKNIGTCANDLDTYIDKLVQCQQSDKKQKEIAKSIRWIFKRLSTFGNKDEDLEYLWGFIYNGYTEELTSFILEAAFKAGLKKARAKTINVGTSVLRYKPERYIPMQLYFGKDDNNGVLLNLNYKTGFFQYEENPYGDSYGIPVFNLGVSADHSEISFEVLTVGSYKAYLVKARNESDRVLFKLLYQVHGKGLPRDEIKPNHCQINIEMEEGMISTLDTMAYNDQRNIIPVGNPDTGVTLGMRTYNKDGEYVSKYQIPAPVITGEKFIVWDNQQDITPFPILKVENLKMNGNELIITTPHKDLKYVIHTIPLMQEALKQILQNRKPFISRFQKN